MRSKIEQLYLKIEKEFKNKLPFILVFSIIFILLFFQHNVIAMYFDDFGNASLSYGQTSKDIIGTNYSLNQLFSWDKMIYNTWGGRILYATVFLIPMLKHGVGIYMFIQSFVITFIIYFLYKIIKEMTSNGSLLIPIVLFILYTLIDMVYLRDGIYWASASVLYIWPLLPLFMFMYLVIKLTNMIKNNKKVNYYLYIPLLVISNFFVTFSHEQIGVALLVFLITYIIIEHRQSIKKYLVLDIPNIIVGLAGYIALIAAPGNYKRMDTNVAFSKLSIFGKITNNYPDILRSIFVDKMCIFVTIFTVLSIIFFIKNSKNVKIPKKILYSLLSCFSIVSIIYLFLGKSETVVTLYGSGWLLFIGILYIIYFYKMKKMVILSIILSGCSSIFCLLVSPVVGGRTGLPFMFFVFLLIGIVLFEILKDSNILLKISLVITIIVLAIFGVKNYRKIYQGYMENYSLEKLNFTILENYEEKDGKTITLYKYPNFWYGSTRSYQEPSMDYWIKEYFDIPQDVTFEWEDIYKGVRQ